MSTTPKPPEQRWCVHFETSTGARDWIDVMARHPAGAKTKAESEVSALGFMIATYHSVTRTGKHRPRGKLYFDLADAENGLETSVHALIALGIDRMLNKVDGGDAS